MRDLARAASTSSTAPSTRRPPPSIFQSGGSAIGQKQKAAPATTR
jgi:hypothetical protein